jgi:hypothetical protein
MMVLAQVGLRFVKFTGLRRVVRIGLADRQNQARI